MFSVCNQIFQNQYRQQQKAEAKKKTHINIKVNNKNSEILNTIQKMEKETNDIISDCQYLRDLDSNTKLYKCIKYVK